MATVREIAQDAHERREGIDRESRINAERERLERIHRATDHAMELAKASGLFEWFPGQQWEVYDTREQHYGWFGHGEAVLCADRPGGTDPTYAEVPCFMVGAVAQPEEGPPNTDPPPVWLVTEQHSDGYSHWDGPRVFSAADVGKYLARREARKGSAG